MGQHPAGRSGPDAFQIPAGRVGSDQEVLETSRVESGRVGSRGYQIPRVEPGDTLTIAWAIKPRPRKGNVIAVIPR